MQDLESGRESIDGILAEKRYRLLRGREWRRLLLECAVIVLVIWALFQYVLGVAVVNGDSMEPYLYDDELVLFYRLERAYRNGDVVVLSGDGNDNIRLVSDETDAENKVSDEGLISIEEIAGEEVMGRVVLHIGFEGL